MSRILSMNEHYIKNIDEMQKLGSYTSNSGDNTYLRGILKKK